MDTKLRDIRKNSITKVVAFFLVVLLITAAVVQMQYLFCLRKNPEVLFVKEYKESGEFDRKVNNTFLQIIECIENEQEIGKDADFYYYIADGNKEYSNVENPSKNFFEQYEDTFYGLEKGNWEQGKHMKYNILENNYIENPEKYTIYLSFPDEFMTQKQQEWENEREILTPYVIAIMICFIFAIALIIYLMIVTGRNSKDKELHLSRLDNIYSDVLLFIFIIIGFIWIMIMIEYSNRVIQISHTMSLEKIFYLILVGGATVFTSISCLSIFLSFVRKWKGRKLITHTFIYQFFYRIYDFIKSLFDGRKLEKYPLTKSLFYRQLVFIVISFILVFFTFSFLIVPPLFLFPPILEAIVIYWYVKYNNQTFEEINKGFNQSLEEQMKSERMKVALITNVSHDLKTPLTSIISYIDLLSKEENLSDSARDYVNILLDKSNRLKQIVSDLFELAKSSSGDIHLDLEILDIKKLMEQTLGDMEDEIKKSGLQIKINFIDHPINIYSDGNKLYRVFQNVIDNALKYSLKGTRIYIELEERNGKALASIKNIAGYEINFTEEEILQRFNQGDKSRSTEGSGLGLSIAQSFTQVCGGEFNIIIDGDLFKVEIGFPIV